MWSRPGGAPRRKSESASSARRDPGGVEGLEDRGFGILNIALLLTSVAVIVVGYWLLSRGSITAAPLLLVLGYVVLIPAALLVGRRGGRPHG